MINNEPAQGDDGKVICHACIGDPFLSAEVKAGGFHIRCSYCEQTRLAQYLWCIASRIHDVLNQHFERTPDYPEDPDDLVAQAIDGWWERHGNSVSVVIAEMAGLSKEVADDVRDELSQCFELRSARNSEENPYSSEAHYEEHAPMAWRFHNTWADFVDGIQQRARFFSNEAGAALENIFSCLDSHTTSGGTPVVREIGPDSGEGFIWRARNADSREQLEAILRSPAQEIGPPPPEFAASNRMNAPGISVFYGAMDQSTCLSEVRPPVGGYVVLAKFELIRPVRILDLDALAKVYVNDSYFDPNYAERQGRAAFLRRLAVEFSRPVMPRDADAEYLPTQVVAEYLANKIEPRLDGILFPSSQTGGRGQNLALFNHACQVEPYELPIGSDVSVDIRTEDERDEIDFIDVYERLPVTEDSGDVTGADIIYDRDRSNTAGEPTLRLDVDNIVALKINGVEYKFDKKRIYRSRTKEEPDDVEEPYFDQSDDGDGSSLFGPNFFEDLLSP